MMIILHLTMALPRAEQCLNKQSAANGGFHSYSDRSAN